MPEPESVPESVPDISDPLKRLARAISYSRIPFADYVRKAWEITEPGKPLGWNWHIDLLCEHLTAVSLGQIKRLIVNIPPRWMKSTLITVDWPTWEWGPFGRPELRYLFVSHEAGLSTMHSVARRNIIDSSWYRGEWGERVKLVGDQNQKTFFQNKRRGMMIATSTFGGATGKGGDRIVYDDFLNPKMAESDAERISGIQQYGDTFSSRLDDKKLGVQIAVEQRLHSNDFTAKLLEEGGWTHVSIPCDNATQEPKVFIFPISGKRFELAPGAITWPEREPAEIIAADRVAKGSRTHDAQCRQNPSPPGGVIFKRHFWKFYDELPKHLDSSTGKWVLTNFHELLQSWDCAFKGLASSDFVVGQCWGRIGADRYLLDQVRGKMGIAETLAAIISFTQKWPRAARKLIEDKANGPAVIELLRTKVPGLIPVNPEGGKIVRARAVEPILEAGNIWLPSPRIAPWVTDFIAECDRFDGSDGNIDDQVDSMTQANIFFTGSPIGGLYIGTAKG